MTRTPSVEVIIPHYRGRALLERCLESLDDSFRPGLGICIVDNGSGAGYIAELAGKRAHVRVVSLAENKGYAGGCNAALFSSRATYAVCFNDDAVVVPGWLDPLLHMAEDDRSIAAIQPKILSLSSRDIVPHQFDYAGAAGGMLDQLCYPWCYGRDMWGAVKDVGQFDTPREIFWASGVALFCRLKPVIDAGGFDEDFFMHMEEIDLCWRLHLDGWKVMSQPLSVVWHEGAASLAEGDPYKVFLNHRNNLVMMLKNMGLPRLLGLLPIRLALELAAASYYLVSGFSGWRSSLAVMRSLFANLGMLSATFRKRREIQASRKVTDRDLFRRAHFSVILNSLFRFSSDASRG
ncbi:glycosyltransferase family 2 protein [Prosthecochloris sp. HL-130-GSB]|jgi:GT2 family glycosyltransferase|uniref:Glycosyltransferase family 2 protein n=1 Tax=Prosthecochloris aestuarii TaxID=1102 RepID=A0A831SQ11_PROAE|nr:glycosyltransferase family 2 protein [Prosthecochloris sp. HL-130-GSB]ARM31272.1 glycosyl hydrolase [Prosthecochloris sp. HL-130-GSB]MBO8092442.1 glycosyltransferase family 2 protein [Prosthecochloris sp.]HED30826.1 glycosyltransferase family 2 protein [Prosthecochloris aestuarii]